MQSSVQYGLDSVEVTTSHYITMANHLMIWCGLWRSPQTTQKCLVFTRCSATVLLMGNNGERYVISATISFFSTNIFTMWHPQFNNPTVAPTHICTQLPFFLIFFYCPCLSALDKTWTSMQHRQKSELCPHLKRGLPNFDEQPPS